MADTKISDATPVTGTGVVSLPAERAGSTTKYRQVNNLTATSNPGVGDDSADGYHVGSLWQRSDTLEVWRCTDATGSAAIWVPLHQATGPLSLMPAFDISTWYVTGVNATHTDTALTANRLYQVPIVVPTRRTFTESAFRLAVLQGTSAIRTGLYNAGSNGKPTTLIADFGTNDSSTGTGVTGKKTQSISQTLNPGFYCLALVSDGTPSIGMHATNLAWAGGCTLDASGNAGSNRGWFRAFTFATLPADESAQSYSSVNSNHPIIGIR